MQNKAEIYRTMLAYLQDLGADLSDHNDIPLARIASTDFGEMGKSELMHYQRLLEATIDHRSPLMDKEALKSELSEVVRERFTRGAVNAKAAEARDFRNRIASL